MFLTIDTNRIPLFLLYAVYSLLIAFWAHLCRKKNMKLSWVGDRSKFLLYITNTALFLLFTAIPYIENYVTNEAFMLIMNVMIGVITLALCIFYIVEGTGVYKVIKDMTGKYTIHCTKMTF